MDSRQSDARLGASQSMSPVHFKLEHKQRRLHQAGANDLRPLLANPGDDGIFLVPEPFARPFIIVNL
jgi:hypothetical protein